MKGLLNPKNAAPVQTIGFREGFVRVQKSSVVVKPPRTEKVQEMRDGEQVEVERIARDKKGIPAMSTLNLRWECQVLNEQLEPIVDHEDNQKIETLDFGFGSKAITALHCGQAASPEAGDDEVEDLGDEPGTEGNTVYMVDPSYQIHPATSALTLYKSLEEAGIDSKYIDRVWAPDWEECVFKIETKFFRDGREMPAPAPRQKGEARSDNDPVAYRVVTSIVRGPGAKKPAGAKVGAKPVAVVGAKSPGKGKAEVETSEPKPKAQSKAEPKAVPKVKENGAGPVEAAQRIVSQVLEDNAGSTLSLKAFSTKCSAVMQQDKSLPMSEWVGITQYWKNAPEPFVEFIGALGAELDEDKNITIP